MCLSAFIRRQEELMKQRKQTRRSRLPLTEALLLVGLIAVVTGCNPQLETTDMHICLEHYISTSRTFTPNSSLSVAYYEIEGSGPDATSFQVSTEDSQVTIPGLLVGDWTVHAIGYSSDGIGLVQGETMITLTNSQQDGTITLEEFYGIGAAEITVSWDESQTINPVVHAYIQQCGPEGIPEELTPSAVAEGSTTYSIPEIAAGAYLFRAELYSEDALIAGATEVIRVINGQTTTGIIPMEFNDLSLGMNLTITDTTDSPVSGTITGIPLTVAANEPIDIAFSPSPDSVQTGLSCMWFLNGQYLTEGNPVTIVPPTGKQRLDVVVTSEREGSAGSAHQIINAVDDIETGAPLLYREYSASSDEEYLIDGICDLEALSDGLIISTAKYDDAIQTFRIQQDSLIVTQTISLDSTYMIDGVSTLAISDNEHYIAAVSDNSNTISIFEHTSGTDTISLVQTILETGANANGTYQFSQIGGIAFNSDGSELFVADRTTNRIIRFQRTESLFTFIDSYEFICLPDLIDVKSLDIRASDDLMAAAVYGSNALTCFRFDSDGDPIVLYSFDYTNYSTLGLSQIHWAKFISDNSLITLSKDSICEFSIEESPLLVPIVNQECRLKETTQIPVLFSPKDLAATSTTEKVYVVTSSGNGIVSFSHDSATHQLTYDTFLSTDDVSPDICAISADNDYLLVGSSTDDRLMLYKFAQ